MKPTSNCAGLLLGLHGGKLSFNRLDFKVFSFKNVSFKGLDFLWKFYVSQLICPNTQVRGNGESS